MPPKKKPHKRGRSSGNMRMEFYCLREISEQTALDVTLEYFGAFPIGLGFRPIRARYTVALSGSAATADGGLVHRSVAGQVQAYGPIDQGSDHVIWSSSPILVPWGQRVSGTFRFSVPWFNASSPKTTKILRLETLCLHSDTAVVATAWCVAVVFQFARPDYSPACPGLRAMAGRELREPPDDDDDHQSSSSSGWMVTTRE